MNLQMANFEDLMSTYYQRTVAHVAAEHLGNLIRGEKQLQFATLLRDYRDRAVTAPRKSTFERR